MQGGGPAHTERVLVNMVDGKMFAEFRSDSRGTLEAWLKTEGMPSDGSLSHLYYHHTRMTFIRAGRNIVKGRVIFFEWMPRSILGVSGRLRFAPCGTGRALARRAEGKQVREPCL
jgi:hypothetical protein